jgi:hypothetical protein
MAKEKKVFNVSESGKIIELRIKPGDQLELEVTTESSKSITFLIKAEEGESSSLSLEGNPNAGHAIYAA